MRVYKDILQYYAESLERRVCVLDQHLKVGFVPCTGLWSWLEGFEARGFQHSTQSLYVEVLTIAHTTERVVAVRTGVTSSIGFSSRLDLSSRFWNQSTSEIENKDTLTQTKASASEFPVLDVGRTPKPAPLTYINTH